MLLEVVLICVPFVFGGITYLFPLKTCYTYGALSIQKIKFHYYGMAFWLHDVIYSRYNKLGE